MKPRQLVRLALPVAASATLLACTPPEGASDAGSVPVDAGSAPDAGDAMDAGLVDAGLVDAGDLARPSLVILSHVDGAALDARAATLEFRVDDADATGYAVTLGDAAPVRTDAAIEAGDTVSVPLTLDVGVNVITVVVYDTGGAAASANVVVVVALGPGPHVTVAAPIAGATVFDENVTLTGMIDSARGVVSATAAVDGGAETPLTLTPVAGGASFTGDIALPLGESTVHVEATDDANQSASFDIVLTRAEDTEAPTIVLAQRTGHAVRARQVTLSGVVTDNNAVSTLVLSGDVDTPVAFDADGAFSVDVTLEPGANTFTLDATDAAGLVSSAVHAVYFGARLGAGGAHGGIISDGTLYTWGRNNIGQTGQGFTSSITADADTHPVAATAVPGMTATFVSLAFAQNASVALDSAGHVWGWGDNVDGQLCLGTMGGVFNEEDVSVPTMVASIADVVAVQRGYKHTLMLKADGTVWACGDNGKGQLGDGTTEDRDMPVQVAGLTDVVMLGAGSQSSYAVDSTGAVWAWGRNQYGNLGQGTDDRDAHSTAVVVPGVTGVVGIANGRDHVLALRADGTVMAWGLNRSGQIAPEAVTGSMDTNVRAPFVIPAVSGAQFVYANGNQSFFEDEDGMLWPWGQNINGSLGIPSEDDRATPDTSVFGLSDLVDVAIGPLQGHAMTADGTVFSWGWSFEGSLGGGASTINRWSYRIPILLAFADVD